MNSNVEKPAISTVLVVSVMIAVLIEGCGLASPVTVWATWSWVFFGYVAGLAVSGIAFMVFRQKWLAWVHVALLAVAGYAGLIYGASVLMDRSVGGGRGPDANPVAGIIYGVALGVVVLGIVCLIMAYAIGRPLTEGRDRRS